MIRKDFYSFIRRHRIFSLHSKLITYRAPIRNNHSAMSQRVNEKIERDPQNLIALESIDFRSSFDSLSIEPAIDNQNHAEVNLEDISFESFNSDTNSSPPQMSISSANRIQHMSGDVLSLSQALNKRAAVSPLKSQSSRRTKKVRDMAEDMVSNDQEKENIAPPTLTPNLISHSPIFSKMHSTLSSGNNQITQQRKLSKTTTRSKKKDSYHSIQLSTQKPLQLENGQTSLGQIKSVKPIILSKEQENILQLVLKGVSLFYTGSAGTGKSILLRTIIKTLRDRNKPGQIAVTASTGLAACNIGGTTLHGFAGVGLGVGSASMLLKRVKRNKKALQRWNEVKVLIIDEVSMIDGLFLDKINELCKSIRKNNKPFGGIQLVVCGDFYQLPPVVRKTAPDGTELLNPEEPTFSFESSAWKEAIKCTIVLKEVFRQKGDQKFIDMLNEMRDGNVSDQTSLEFRKLSRELDCSEGIVPAELFATRKEVDRSNNTKLSKIEGDAQVYKAVDAGTLENPQRQNLLNNFLAPQNLYLKKHAQVMCIKNFDDNLVNGSLGQVIDFMDRNTYMKAYLKQEVDNSGSSEKVNEDGKESDFIFDFKDRKEATDEEKLNNKRKKALVRDLESDSSGKLYPLVKFLLPDGINTRTILVEPEQWTVEDEHQKILLSRVQLPIILAWSLSIHKSQGQTLPKVKVDLRNVFENGQSYVALSRAVSRSGLQVLNFDKYKVRAHAKVIKFYRSLSSASDNGSHYKGQLNIDSLYEKGHQDSA
ncbi:uncharacterized protein PRCAT00002072001 [Priceomyces carsonii]|uniref:uncharacterized protein n=1 Tax=Priceomyces carsonii TaxID=28549 RepID=UPI002EDA84AE|nr:unnamed protein product [Priceomyces carsonii]